MAKTENEPGAAAAKLAELNLNVSEDIKFNLDSMFPKLSGWGAKGEIKEKVRIINNVEPFLRDILMENEVVRYIAKGVQYKFSEQYFLGIWAQTINQTVFVLTNLRLLMVHSTSKGVPKNVYWLIYYSEIDKFKGSALSNVRLVLRDKQKFTFLGFKGTDRKSMPQIFEEALDRYDAYGFEPEVTQSRENLCCECLTVVPKDTYECKKCQQEFWRPGQIAVRSLIFPSWGDFIMKHTLLAFMELVGYIFTWIIFGVIILDEDTENRLITSVFLLLFLAAEHAVDAALTYYIAKKGLTPKG
ncbi:MAG: hypothetical protein CMJ78_25710 [Planctomycetaceae bacterium]|nr:hypothetical protein [Planctomycetaceae bacterium]